MQNDTYRITLAVRDGLTNNLIEERLIQDGITDINDMTNKFHLALKSFKKLNGHDIVKKPGCNYYVEVTEICGTEVNRIAFVLVLLP